MASRNDVLIQTNAIGASDLQRLLDHVRHAPRADSVVSNFDEAVDAEWVVNHEIRDTQEVHVPQEIRRLLNRIANNSFCSCIEAFYAVEVRDCEPLQILHYGSGGHYIPHVDAETLYKDDDGLELWEKTLDRDLSLVYFLNDDFTGGELFFPTLELTIKPEAGTLVCFPSDHNFIHGVRPVTHGHRFTIVTWARVAGMPSMDEINQAAMDEYERHRPKQVEQPSRLMKRGSTTR
jgi:predicted 2-oxoglutarate/Fe(II)-dependent dioxygenase YbiX